MHTFKIETQYVGIEEKLSVYLDGEMIYEVDNTKYCGFTRDNMPEICKRVSEKLGRTVTSKEISTARMLGYISEGD
jgi:hypothetical protein